MANSAREYAGVVLIGGMYAAIHSTPQVTRFISKHPETDEKVARAAAQSFAEQSGIPVHDNILSLTKPIVTVWKKDSLWVPLLIDSAGLIPVQGYNGNKSQKAVIELAKKIARCLESDCIPSIGISACSKS